MWSLLLCLTFGCSADNDAKYSATKESKEISVALTETWLMDSCRIKAKNRDFYLHKYKAEKIISKYQKNNNLSSIERKLLTNARSCFAFARTDYLIQVGKIHEARKVMEELASNSTLNLYSDTTMWLNFLYHQGKVLYHPYYISQNKKDILQGYDCIVQSYILSSRKNYPLYKALSLQILSVYLLNDSIFSLAKEVDKASIRYINEDNMPDSLLAGNLAERSLSIFLKLNDPYHTADAWCNLARCYFQIGDARRSIECLNIAIANPATDSMPDLLASINEQFSLSFAAIDDKHNSDFYRNAYLDLQDSTRQDRELEARAVALQESTTKIWYFVAIAFTVFILLCVTTIILTRIRRRKERNATEEQEMLEQLQEELLSCKLLYADALRSAVEQRAQLSIVNGMTPLIDRMKIAVYKQNLGYAKELADEIDKQNILLTQWIKLRRGVIQPKIETFALQTILDVISKNGTILNSQHIKLIIQQTSVKVKADHTLTLFLINTLVDNARKAINETGTITVLCTEHTDDKYVEISISDTGKGMTDTQLEHIFEYKVIHNQSDTQSHGFGLVNCRGIIDRYRKMSSIFTVCTIFAKSTKGKGTTIFFRLPLAVKSMIITLLCCMPGITHITAKTSCNLLSLDSIAAIYCDSLYQCNVEGRYKQAMLYSDSCSSIIKRDSTIDVGIRLSLYNETSVAALALHQWDIYIFNNYLFTRLYKEYTADSSLASYCQTMENNEKKANIAMIIALLLIIGIFPIFWFVYLRHLLKFHKGIRDKKQLLKEDVKKTKLEYEHLHIINNVTDNQLSTLKHETMYYPGRIRQLINNSKATNDLTAIVSYYSELYRVLNTQAMNRQASSLSFRVDMIQIGELFPNINVTGTIINNCDNITILANKELMTYLNVLLRRHNEGKTPPCYVSKCDEKYVTINFCMTNNKILSTDVNSLFSTETPDVDFLIMRQIIREAGNASMRYGSGITAVTRKGITEIVVTMPKK